MNDSQDRNPVEVLADDFVERFRNGERPALTEYTDRHPDLADEIRELFPLLVEMEGVRSSDDSAAPLSDATTVPELKQLGDYRIIREIGRGGMGIVYEAEQVSLGRHVALKVLPNELLDNPKQRSRFEREAKAAAKLHHTNIVPVFGVGEDDGMNYYVMQFIRGLALDEVLNELKQMKQTKPGSSGGLLHTAEIRVHRRDEAVRDVARSLMTGTFQQAAEEATSKVGKQDVLDATLIQSAESSAAPALSSSTATGRLSDTFSLSDSSVVLPGRTKDRSEKTTKKQTYWNSIAQIGVQVADALQYAHDQSVLHRDIKPANLLLDMQGTVWVTDFGLAKLEDERNLTQTGDILGTMRYMAPECFKGKSDARSEIYSLGLTLYELLAFRPAFDEKNRSTLIQQVMTAQVERLRKLNPEIPSDLHTIIHKAIEGDPEHRYQSAAELAEDLQRYIDDEPIKARRISLTERVRRWSRRNKGLAASLSAVALLTVLSVIGSAIAAGYFKNLSRELMVAQKDAERKADVNARLADEKHEALGLQTIVNQQLQTSLENENAALQEQTRQRDEADRQKAFAQNQLERAEWLLYANQIKLAQMEWSYGDPTIAREALDSCRLSFRGWEHDYLHTEITRNQRTLQGHSDAIDDVVFSPDGKRIVSSSWDNTLKIWDVETGRTIDTLRGHTDDILSVCFSPDGNHVASGSRDGTVKIWDVQSDRPKEGIASLLAGVSKMFGRKENWRLVRTLDRHSGQVLSVSFSPDGDRIASGSRDKTLRVWDAKTGKNTLTLKAEAFVSSVAFSPDGTRIVSGSADYTGTTGEVRIWNAETGEGTHRLRGHTEAVRSVDFSPDGTRIVSSSHRDYLRSAGDIRMWNAETGDEIRTFSMNTGGVFHARFSPDGRRIISGNGDRTIKVWDADTGRDVLTLKGHMRMVLAANFSPDGKQIVSGSWDNTIKVWDVQPREESSVLRGHRSPVRGLVYSRDGKWIASASQDDTVRIWDAVTGLQQRVLVGHVGNVLGIDFSPDGQHIVSGGADETVRIWDVRSGLQQRMLTGHRGIVNGVHFRPDGQRIVSGSGDKTVRVWNAKTGQIIFTMDGHKKSVRDVSFSPDGNQIVSGSDDRSAIVWDAETGKQQRKLRGHADIVQCLSFSSDGEHVVTGSGDKTVKVWEVNTGQLTLTLKGHTDAVWDVSFSPDDKRILSGSYEGRGNPGELKIWNADSGQELLGQNTDGLCLCFSPDGKRILSGGVNGRIKIWNASARQNTHTWQGHRSDVHSVGFSPDGKRIASAGKENTIKVWDADTGAEKLNLDGHSKNVNSVVFSPDSGRIVSAGADKTIRIWDAVTGLELLTIDGHSDEVFDADFSSDGKRIVSASADDTIKIWNAGTGTEIAKLTRHSRTVRSVAFSADGKLIVGGGDDNTIRLWNADSGEQTKTLTGHEARVLSVAFSRDGTQIVSAGDDNTIRIWDAAKGDEVLTFLGHSGPIHNVSFSSDGTRIVSGSSDKTIKVWDAQTGAEILTYANHTEAVFDVRFSPDDKSLVSGSADTTVRIWSLPEVNERIVEVADDSTEAHVDTTDVELPGIEQQAAAKSHFDMPTSPMIYWTDRRIPGICRMNLDGSNAQSILWNLGEPRGLLLHNGTELYYCDYELDHIGQTDLIGAPTQLVIPMAPGVRGIAIDDRSNKIYWTDRELKKTYRADLDGKDVEELISEGLVYPYAIQIDPISAKLFVEDHGAGIIFRSNLDGSDREEFVTMSPQGHAGGMVLDAEARMLYYKDGSGLRIMRIGLDDDRREVVIRASNDVLGLTIDRRTKKLYWADTDIRRSNLDGTQIETVMETSLGAVKSIVIYHPPSRTPDVGPVATPEEDH